MLLIGLVSYVPLYAQGVLGTDALVAGFALAAMTIGLADRGRAVRPALPAHRVPRHRLHRSALVVVGTGSAADRGRGQLGAPPRRAPRFVVGLGLGFIASPTLVAAQSSVGWETRGVVTGTNMFARSVGSAVGIAVFGAVANAAVAGRGVRRDRQPGTGPGSRSLPRAPRRLRRDGHRRRS